MKYTLMHKEVKVLDMIIDENSGKIEQIVDTYYLEHLPIGVIYKKGIVERDKLNEWWLNRSIPASRDKIEGVLQDLNISSPQVLLLKCYGLSLSDQYWVKPHNIDLEWKKINFFDNDFSEDIGNILIGNRVTSDKIDMMSPDNTSEGNLKKRWKIINGKRILLKSGSGSTRQEVFNEKIASKIMELLNINHVEYEIYWENQTPYCGCEDFIDSNEDFVSAWSLLATENKSNDKSYYEHLSDIAIKHGINSIKQSLDEMLVLDYIILNEDRHYRNFGFIRDVNTLKFKRFAPIFDSGSSLGFETPTKLLDKYEPNWKPFSSKRIRTQLDLVSDFTWINIDKLSGIEKIIVEVYKDSKDFVDEQRINEIVLMVNKRIATLKSYIEK